LIDVCHVVVHPIILGGGQRALPENIRINLELLDEHRFDGGVTHMHYRVIA
jgi:dihydrofolate reductase